MVGDETRIMKLDNENDTGRINENMRRFMFSYLVQGLERIFKARSKRPFGRFESKASIETKGKQNLYSV